MFYKNLINYIYFNQVIIYIMKFLDLKNDGKNDYYELKTKEKLYRGDDRNIDIKNYYPRFFTNEEKYAKVYGKIIYKFIVNKDLKLLAVDKNIKDFYDNSPTNIQNILKDNYGYESKKRLSESKKDNDLLDDICKNPNYDYDGYATDKMDTEFSHFDPEITICNSKENLSEATKVNTEMSEKDIKTVNAEARLIEQNKLDKENRRKKTRTPRSPVKFDNNDSIFTRLAFGGKRKSKKKYIKKKGKSPKFWRDMKPSKKGRKTYKKKYGSRCFLLPSQLKYPVCDKKTGKMNCKGLLAAYYRASLSIRRKLKPKTYSYRKITSKAKKLAKKHKCNWTKKR
tara:strand:+ start:515 stop:1531 length:1017 start_codon:yes stop_codon:yes gene_type:complete